MALFLLFFPPQFLFSNRNVCAFSFDYFSSAKTLNVIPNIHSNCRNSLLSQELDHWDWLPNFHFAKYALMGRLSNANSNPQGIEEQAHQEKSGS